MEATERKIRKVVYPNLCITVKSTCSEWGDINTATLFKTFEMTGNHSYNCIHIFLTYCI